MSNTPSEFAFNVRSGNQVAYDGNAMALQGLARGIAAIEPEERIRYYVDRAPQLACFRSGPRRAVVVLPPWRGGNRVLRRLGVEPWYQLRMQFELWRRSPTVYFQVGQEPLPLHMPCPSVLLIHDVAFRLPEADRFFDAALKERLERVTGAAMRRAARVVAVSHACKADVTAHYGYPAERIDVAQHGFDADRFQPIDPETARARLHERCPQVREPYALFVGRIQPRKNLERLLHAWHEAKQRGLRQKLLVVGKQGWSSTGIYAQVEDLGLAGDVHFLGSVPMADVPLLMNGADFFTLPSICEGFGIPALEAMACGVPVLGGDSGGLPEVIGDTGLLVDPLSVPAMTEALLHLGGDHDLRQQLGARALARSQRFSWERAAGVVLESMRQAARA